MKPRFITTSRRTFPRRYETVFRQVLYGVWVTLLIGAMEPWAAEKSPEAVALTETGRKLEEIYAERLAAVKTDVMKAVPVLSEQVKAVYLRARADEVAAENARDAAKQNLDNLDRAQGLVNHARVKWIGGAENGIAAAEAKLKAAETDAERKAAAEELAHWKKNKEEGLAALRERQAMLEEARHDEPRHIREFEAAEASLIAARDAAR
jgi:hypothetical protein